MRPHKVFAMMTALALSACPGRPEPVPVEMEEPASAVLVCQEACAADADCPDGLRCADEAGRCVACVGDGDCDAGKCLDGACVECVADEDCSGSPAGGRCGAGGACICATDDDCEAPLGTCRSTGCVCSEDAGCAGVGPERCEFGVCVRCAEDAHCADGPSKCFAPDTIGAYCGCASDSECPAATPHCDPETGACSMCHEDSDCVEAGLGTVCAEGQCTCSAASDCAAPVSHAGLEWVCR